jgi:hypothetical protein
MGQVTYQLQSSVPLGVRGDVMDTYGGGTTRITVSDERIFRNVQEIGSGAANLMSGNIVNAGLMVFQNLSESAIVQVGGWYGEPFIPANSALRFDAYGNVYLLNSDVPALWHEWKMVGSATNGYIAIDVDGTTDEPIEITGYAPTNAKLRIVSTGLPYLYNADSDVWHALRMHGAAGSVYLGSSFVGQPMAAHGSEYWPPNSLIRFNGDGAPCMYNSVTDAWHSFRIAGASGSAYLEMEQDGVPLTEPDGDFRPFVEIRPGERQIMRISVTAGNLYARALGGNAELFYLIYED